MVIRFETTSVEKGKVKKRRIFRFIVSEIAEAKIPLSIIPFLSIYLFVNKAKIPWCIIIIGNSYRSSFLINKAKMHPSSTILRLPFIPRIVYLFIDQKTKIPYRKTIPRIPNKISIHLFFLFFIIIINESIHRIPNGEYQSRVNYSCLRVVIETDRPISRELISVTCH